MVDRKNKKILKYEKPMLIDFQLEAGHGVRAGKCSPVGSSATSGKCDNMGLSAGGKCQTGTGAGGKCQPGNAARRGSLS